MRWFRRCASSCAALIAIAPPLSAEPAKKTTTKKDETAPPPRVELRIEPRSPRAWAMTVANTGDAPLKIVADARLLRLEIAPSADEEESKDAQAEKTLKKKGETKTAKSIECVLPAAMRSSERTLVLAPGSRYLEVFDPRLFCLDASKHLVDGAKVTARLGWSSAKGKAKGKAEPKPPFVVAPASTKDDVAPLDEIASSTFVLPAKAAFSPTTTAAPSPAVPLVAHSGAGHSAFDGKGAHVTLRIVNASAEARRVYARPQLVGAIVRSPRGVITSCDGWARPAPIVDFVVALAPKGEWAATISLDEVCPASTFDVPGLYEITPRLHADPVPWEPKAVVGEIIADTPELLRIETGKKPFHDAPPVALDTSE